MLPSSVGKLTKSAVSQSECDNEVRRGVYVGVVPYVQHADGGGSRLDTEPPHIHTVRCSDCQQEVWDILVHFHVRSWKGSFKPLVPPNDITARINRLS